MWDPSVIWIWICETRTHFRYSHDSHEGMHAMHVSARVTSIKEMLTLSLVMPGMSLVC